MHTSPGTLLCPDMALIVLWNVCVYGRSWRISLPVHTRPTRIQAHAAKPQQPAGESGFRGSHLIPYGSLEWRCHDNGKSYSHLHTNVPIIGLLQSIHDRGNGNEHRRVVLWFSGRGPSGLGHRSGLIPVPGVTRWWYRRSWRWRWEMR